MFTIRHTTTAAACCATTGDGLFDGLDWLAKELPASAKKKVGETSKTK